MNPEPDAGAIERGQEVEIDLMQPRDAPGVAALFRLVYGQGYPVPTYYHPQELIQANQEGEIISVVARTAAGDIVGHNSLFNSAPHPKVYESGAGVVHPLYRNGSLFKPMIQHGVEVGAPRFGVEMVFGEPVTNHRVSQRIVQNLGWVSRALEAALMPAAAYDQEKSAAGRVSTLLNFITTESHPREVFVPPFYRDQFDFCYQDMDDQRRFLPAEQKVPRQRQSRLEVQVFDFAGVARMATLDAGRDLVAVLAEREKELAQERGVVVFQLWLNLSWPWVGELARELEGAGYFLGGVLPRWLDQDAVLLQKLLVEPDWEGAQLLPGRNSELLSMVKAEWKRVCGG